MPDAGEVTHLGRGPVESAALQTARSAFFMHRRLRVQLFTRCARPTANPEPLGRFFLSGASQTYFFFASGVFSSSSARGLSVSSSLDLGIKSVYPESRFSRASSRVEVNVT